jgi:hypothetical protein
MQVRARRPTEKRRIKDRLVATLSLDVCKVIADASSCKLGSPSVSEDHSGRFRAILSMLLTPGHNEEIDRVCQERLRVAFAAKPVGFSTYVQFLLDTDCILWTTITFWTVVIPPRCTPRIRGEAAGVSLPMCLLLSL